VRSRRLHVNEPPRSEEAVLDPETSRHAARVLRLQRGDEVVLFDGRGREWPGTLLGVDRRAVRVRVGGERESPRPAGPRVRLATAIPKGRRMTTLLTMATEAGVDGVVPVAFARSAVTGSRPGKVEHWHRAMVEAARQCGRAWLPELEPETPLADLLARPPEPGEVRLLPTTRGVAPPLAEVLAAAAGAPGARLTLLIGPEGGFEAGEEEAAAAAGYLPCSLGENILRVETAGVVAVAMARAGRGSAG